jgi:hypothetical protein
VIDLVCCRSFIRGDFTGLYHDRSKHLIVNVEVVVREAAALRCQDPVVGVFGRILRHADAEGRSLFHALENEIDSIGALLAHAAQPGQDLILFADTFLVTDRVKALEGQERLTLKAVAKRFTRRARARLVLGMSSVKWFFVRAVWPAGNSPCRIERKPSSRSRTIGKPATR